MSSGRSARAPWTPDEIERLVAAVEASRTEQGKVRWSDVARKVGTRNRVQCYQRSKYIEEAKRDRGSRRAWTTEETVTLLQRHSKYGNRWTMYRDCLPERSPVEVKGKFLSLQRSLFSENSDIWRLPVYSPYRGYLRGSLLKRCRLCVCASSGVRLSAQWNQNATDADANANANANANVLDQDQDLVQQMRLLQIFRKKCRIAHRHSRRSDDRNVMTFPMSHSKLRAQGVDKSHGKESRVTVQPSTVQPLSRCSSNPHYATL